jgi:hypothetical protein
MLFGSSISVTGHTHGRMLTVVEMVHGPAPMFRVR